MKDTVLLFMIDSIMSAPVLACFVAHQPPLNDLRMTLFVLDRDRALLEIGNCDG